MAALGAIPWWLQPGRISCLLNGMNGAGPKKGEQALIVPQRESPVLNLDDGVGELRVLLRLLL